MQQCVAAVVRTRGRSDLSFVFSKLAFKRREHEGKIRGTMEASSQTVPGNMTKRDRDN